MYKLTGLALAIVLLTVLSWITTPTIIAMQWRTTDVATRRKMVAVQRATLVLFAIGLFAFLAARGAT